MTGDTIECFNCGHVNPGWAQVCRSCGVPLRHAAARTAPTGPVPTDRDSLISMGAVIATVVLAVAVGFVLSSLYSSTPTTGLGPDETPLASVQPSLFPSASEPAPTPTAVATPSPTPALPGTVTFGTGISNGQITGPTDTFTPSVFFAHVITVTEPFGVNSLGEQVVRVAQDGTETEVVAAAGNVLANVDPASTSVGVVCCRAAELIRPPPDGLGPGIYILRVFRGDELIAEARFTLAEG